jgi:murein DD-endopeptidase MepM/ murein hydrolase activator NlpD
MIFLPMNLRYRKNRPGPGGLCEIAGPLLLALALATGGCTYGQKVTPVQQSYSDQFGGVYHTVEKGQNLWRISKAYGVDLETVQWVNDVDDVTDLRVGRVLFIPGATEVKKVAPRSPVTSEPRVSTARLAMIWPLKGRLSSGFGPRGRRKHKGIDIPEKKGLPVKAAANGRVAYSGDGMRGYGKVIVLKHENDLSTVYAHNSALLVSMGERVKQGQTIARVGSTGRSTGPHLHFEVRRRGIAEDPLTHLPAP